MKGEKGAGIANTSRYLTIRSLELAARIFTCIIYISHGPNMRYVRPGRAQGHPYDRSGTSVESRASYPNTERYCKRESSSREICKNPVA